MNNIHNRKYLEERRKELRKNLTSAEATLWKYLQRKQLDGHKFRRQHSIENFIVDFYCPKEKLIIELDGAYHLDFAQQNYDLERTDNKLVYEAIEFVLEEISSHFSGL